ncbi:MAG TPA: hypothetical protein VE619_05725 [Nitrososphaeraceae archaeon]|nr:hypothetical protein [Nitrososphaeraceae archaeon]
MLNLKKADRNESWCTLSIDKTILTAKIQHMGRGKFKILAAENSLQQQQMSEIMEILLKKCLTKVIVSY